MAPPPPAAGTPPPPAGGLKKLELLDLRYTRITDDGCATLAAALDSGALPALQELELEGTRVSAEAKAAVFEARANLGGAEYDSEDEDEDEEEEEAEEEWINPEWDEDESGEDEGS